MILRLVLAELRHRPGRMILLVLGYAFGVAVMVVLLAVGEAMLAQARDTALVGGGDVMILPAGVSPEMLKAGGTATLYTGLDQARFIQRQILESPRGRDDYGVLAASPLLDGRLLRVGRASTELTALATGEIPSRSRAVGAAPHLLSGRWEDSDADRRWASPSPEELFHEIDAFHLPRGAAAADSTWAEWHYFNVVLDDDRWLYLTFMVGGRLGVQGEWGGQLLLTVRDPETGYRSLSREVSDQSVRFDTLRADVSLDDLASVRQEGGVYHVRAVVAGADLDLRFRPRPFRLFPPADLGGVELVSGYVVPALRADVSGRVCLPGAATGCMQLTGAPGYHDHNWGVWRDVSWEWGAASDEELSLLYGVVRGGEGPEPGLFAYLTDDRGVRGVFRPGQVEFTGTRRVVFADAALDIPTGLRFEDRRRGLRVDIDIDSHQATDTERDQRRYFLQLRGTATVHQIGFEPQQLPGFFETYVDEVGGS